MEGTEPTARTGDSREGLQMTALSARMLFPGPACWKALPAVAATEIAFCRFWQPLAVGGLGKIHFNS